VALCARQGDGDRRHDQRALVSATVEVVSGRVSTIFKAAVRDPLGTASPCEGIRPPEVHKAQVEPPWFETVDT
jgi:hypothetical protein